MADFLIVPTMSTTRLRRFQVHLLTFSVRANHTGLQTTCDPRLYRSQWPADDFKRQAFSNRQSLSPHRHGVWSINHIRDNLSQLSNHVGRNSTNRRVASSRSPSCYLSDIPFLAIPAEATSLPAKSFVTTLPSFLQIRSRDHEIHKVVNSNGNFGNLGERTCSRPTIVCNWHDPSGNTKINGYDTRRIEFRR